MCGGVVFPYCTNNNLSFVLPTDCILLMNNLQLELHNSAPPLTRLRSTLSVSFIHLVCPTPFYIPWDQDWVISFLVIEKYIQTFSHIALHLDAITHNVLKNICCPTTPPPSLPLVHLLPYPVLYYTLFLFYPHPTFIIISLPNPPLFLPSSLSATSLHSCTHPTLIPATFLLHSFKVSLDSISSSKSSRICPETTKSFLWRNSGISEPQVLEGRDFYPTFFSPVSLVPSSVPGAQWKLNRYAE